MQKDMLTVEDITQKDLRNIFKLAGVLKRHRVDYPEKPLLGKTIGLIFTKSSTRTRVSFEVGIHELGGNAIFLTQNEMQLGRGETIRDTAKVLSRYLHGIVIRTHEHREIVELAKHANFPVINALTNEFHPCQILADLFTIFEYSTEMAGIKLAYLGDCASNIANSLILGARLSGLELKLSSPEEYKPRSEFMTDGNTGPGKVSWTSDPKQAVKDAEYIYTDVWVSMGFEDEKKKRMDKLKPYQVNNEIIELADDNVKVMHCLPAHRGEEITDEVIDSPCSIVLDQAENRLHVQKAILAMLLDENWHRLLKK